MHHSPGLDQDEVVHEFACARDSLSSHAGATTSQIGRSHGGDKLRTSSGERAATPRSQLFLQPRSPMFSGHSPEPRPSHDLEGVPQLETRARIAFTRPSEDGIRSRFDTTMNPASKMNAEKWERGIRNRINQISVRDSTAQATAANTPHGTV